MELFTYLMAKNDHNTSVNKDLFSYLLGKNQSGTYTDYSGTSLSINNTKKGKMKVNLLGNTSQTGTPTPSSPIPVNVVSGDNTITTSNGDNTQSQTYPINLPDGMFLGGISTYKDRFLRNSGKNLCNITLDSSVTGNINYTTYTLKPNSQYTISTNTWVTSSSTANIFASAGTSFTPSSSVNGVNGSRTVTSDSEGKITIGYRNVNNLMDYTNGKYWIMLNEGETALPYEPYGTNEWYLEKKIGKKVLNGTENWQRNAGIDTFNITLSDSLTDNTISTTMSGYFSNCSFNNRNTGTNPRTYIDNHLLQVKNSGYSDIDVFKTWLTSHNTNLYYLLSSPTYTQITGTYDTLASQLETAWRTNSYKGQTNISQVNDDLPFNLDVEVKVGS